MNDTLNISVSNISALNLTKDEYCTLNCVVCDTYNNPFGEERVICRLSNENSTINVIIYIAIVVAIIFLFVSMFLVIKYRGQRLIMMKNKARNISISNMPSRRTFANSQIEQNINQAQQDVLKYGVAEESSKEIMREYKISKQVVNICVQSPIKSKRNGKIMFGNNLGKARGIPKMEMVNMNPKVKYEKTVTCIKQVLTLKNKITFEGMIKDNDNQSQIELSKNNSEKEVYNDWIQCDTIKKIEKKPTPRQLFMQNVEVTFSPKKDKPETKISPKKVLNASRAHKLINKALMEKSHNNG